MISVGLAAAATTSPAAATVLAGLIPDGTQYAGVIVVTDYGEVACRVVSPAHSTHESGLLETITSGQDLRRRQPTPPQSHPRRPCKAAARRGSG